MKSRLERWAGALRCVRQFVPPRGDGPNILAKDNIGVEGFATTAGSHALRNLRLPDAFCVARLRGAGFDVFGKANMTELVGFVSTRSPDCGYSEMGSAERNPHGDFPTGGSSAGSGIAVAAGLADAALGTETRGSLMLPGLRNGVWSYKPAVGLVSRAGIVPLSHTFDTPGVLARSMSMVFRVAEAMRGVDPAGPATSAASGIVLSEGVPDGAAVSLRVLEFPGDGGMPSFLETLRPRLQEAGVELMLVGAEPR